MSRLQVQCQSFGGVSAPHTFGSWLAPSTQAGQL